MKKFTLKIVEEDCINEPPLANLGQSVSASIKAGFDFL